ncbi:hypothetical protein [uncultured Aquimarina sp.]|uniref:hypothetical protein n=1 Tax=uncultured Aquimarina sp. TaxID=575652 RepID=UPI0026311E8D|nr:hypothetical protein [uncultured Aquimarina sp.]
MLLKLPKKPYLLFCGIIPLLLLLSNYEADQTLDINIHDTYYVFSRQHLIILVSILFGLTGFIYWLLERFNFKTLTLLNLLHLIFTVGIILINSMQEFLVDYFLGKSYYTNSHVPNSSIWLFILIISIGQIIFVVNIFLAILKGKSYTTKV